MNHFTMACIFLYHLHCVYEKLWQVSVENTWLVLILPLMITLTTMFWGCWGQFWFCSSFTYFAHVQRWTYVLHCPTNYTNYIRLTLNSDEFGQVKSSASKLRRLRPLPSAFTGLLFSYWPLLASYLASYLATNLKADETTSLCNVLMLHVMQGSCLSDDMFHFCPVQPDSEGKFSLSRHCVRHDAKERTLSGQW